MRIANSNFHYPFPEFQVVHQNGNIFNLNENTVVRIKFQALRKNLFSN